MDTLFISDLDGTLLDHSAHLSPATRSGLGRLLADGLAFTVATGRTPLSVEPILRGLPLTVPWVLMNGALILSPRDGTVLEQVPLEEVALEGLIRAEAELGVSGLLLGTKGGRLCATLGASPTPLWQKFFHRNHIPGGPAALPGGAAEWRGESLLYGVYLHRDIGALEVLGKRLVVWGGFQLEIYRDMYDPGTCCLELYSAAATKGRGAEALRRLTGARRLVAFGDSTNDLSLFRACDVSYAVGNARPEVKGAAHGVIGSCEADGVIRYLEGRRDCEEVV